MRNLNDLTIAVIQTNLIWEDSAANKSHFDQLLAKANGADLVILPEMFTTGFSMQPEKLAEPDGGATTQWLKQWASELQAVVTGSLIISNSRQQYFNRLLWARPDATLVHYDKRHLFRMAEEHKHYSVGQHQLLVEHKGWKIRPLICYDLRFPVWSRDAHNTDLLLYVANWPSKRRKQWNRLLAARAIENLCFAVGVNRLGVDGNHCFYSGDSRVIDYLGNMVLNCKDQQGIFFYTLSAKQLLSFRESFPAYQDADLFSIR